MEGREGAELKEVARGIFEIHTKRPGIDSMDADLGKVSEFSFCKSLGIFDRIELIVILGARLRLECVMPRFHEVLGLEGKSIAPFGIGADMKCVGFSVWRDLPAFGDAGRRLAVFVVGAKSFEKSVDDPAFRLACDDRWVECFGFGSVEENQVSPLIHLSATGDKPSENCHANPEGYP